LPPLDLLTNFPNVNQTKAELKCSYKGRELKKRYVPDLLVFGVLVVEIKAVTELAPEHEAQIFNYMRIARQPLGYLINFGDARVETAHSFRGHRARYPKRLELPNA
jgi:GxxExxY protein